MSLLSRTKGRAFEQKIAAQLRAAFPAATVRRSLQAHKAYEPDVVIEGDAPELVKRLWLECNDARAPQPLDKLAQAERDVDAQAAPSWREPGGKPIGLDSGPAIFSRMRLPVVVWHKYGARDVQASMRTGTWMRLMFPASVILDAFRTDGIPITLDWEHLLSVLKEAT